MGPRIESLFLGSKYPFFIAPQDFVSEDYVSLKFTDATRKQVHLRMQLATIFRTLAFVLLFGITNYCPNTAVCQTKDKQESAQPDPYAFDSRAYSQDRKKGFSVVMKLIFKAEKDGVPPATAAKLRYHAARLKRMMALNTRDGEPDFSPCITLLRSVLKKPDRYLSSYESAQWYGNCAGLLTAVYGSRGDSEGEVASTLRLAIASIESSASLSAREKLLIGAGIRMTGSDNANRLEDWPAAIAWVKPIIDASDQYLIDDDGAYKLGMAVRQQSMFLAKNEDWALSSGLIDSTCDKLEDAAGVSPGAKLRMLCMLRGKHLLNFAKQKSDERFELGWKQYEALSKRARSYQGADRAEVLRSCLNMNRLAMHCLEDKNIEAAAEMIKHTMELFGSEPKLQNARFGALSSLEEMTLTVCLRLSQTDQKRANELQQELRDRLKEFKTPSIN